MTRFASFLAAGGIVAMGACGDVREREIAGPEAQPAERPAFARPSDAPPTQVTFRDDGADNVRSDGRGSYVDGKCGVSAILNNDDALLRTAWERITKREAAECGTTEERFLTLTLDEPADGLPALDPPDRISKFMNIHDLQFLPIGVATAVNAGFTTGACPHNLKFNPEQYPGTNQVQVTRTSESTWIAEAVAPNDVAVCVPDEHGNKPAGELRYFHVPFRVTIEKL